MLYFVVVTKSWELDSYREEQKGTLIFPVCRYFTALESKNILYFFKQIKTICIKTVNVDLHIHFNIYVNLLENMFLLDGYVYSSYIYNCMDKHLQMRYHHRIVQLNEALKKN